MITLSTIVYDGNFDKVLSEDCWFFKFKSELISEKLIIVNNLKSENAFFDKIDKMRLNHNFKIVFVEDEKNHVINKFRLFINEQTVGYYYTIPYFVLINVLKTEFVLNVASDCMDDINITDDFLTKSKLELIYNERCNTTMVSWTKNNYIMANGLTIGRHENTETFRKLGKEYADSESFNYSFGFTDQLFMAKTSRLLDVDFDVPENISGQIYNGPSYGGNSFEKRMVGHFIKNNICNCIYKGKDYYIHDGHYY